MFFYRKNIIILQQVVRYIFLKVEILEGDIEYNEPFLIVFF